MSELRVVLLDDDAVAPQRAHGDEDAGYDLRALHGISIPRGEVAMVGTGVAIELPLFTAGLVLPRSGLASKYSVTVVNAPGLIDPGYRGEVKVALINHGSGTYCVNPGDRVAQLLITPFVGVNVVTVPELSETVRGRGGFGSTGIKEAI